MTPIIPERRSKRIDACLYPKEHEKVMAAYKNSTCRSIAEYVRTVLLKRPITMFYRDKAYDEFTEAAIQFRHRLDALLDSGILPDVEKERVIQEMKTANELLAKIYDHVRQNKISGTKEQTSHLQ
jgi:hypothetical protein